MLVDLLSFAWWKYAADIIFLDVGEGVPGGEFVEMISFSIMLYIRLVGVLK